MATMNEQATERIQYGVNIYTMKAHIIKRWQDYATRSYVTLCGRAGGGNAGVMEDLPSCYDLCPRCAGKANG